jgi:hypothetical protein
MAVISVTDSGIRKRDIIEMMFEECGSAGYEFDRTPEEVSSALRKLNAMMAEWPFDQIGYIQPISGAGEPDDLTGVPAKYNQVIALQLALRFAPNMGASLPPESRAALTRSMALLSSETATITGSKIISSVSGAGNRRRSAFIHES